jgi:2-alkyl-3-oxoalkanoate reductase
MRVFLTGATGLIGSHTAEELTRAGHEVVALCRANADTRFLDRLPCTVVRGDVRSGADALVPLVEGCQRLVHTAAQVYVGGSWPRVREVNVDGTRNILTAARLAGVEHVVHLSTVAVYGPVQGPIDEREPIDAPLPPTDLYARSKREAEEVVRGIEDRRGLPVTVLRPSAVYGERDRLTNTLPVVYAGNVAVAVRLAVEKAVGGETYNVAMDHPLTQRELFEGLAAGMGRSPRFVVIPPGIVRSGGDILGRFGVSAPGAKHLPLQRVVDLALAPNPFRSERIRSDLGWEAPHAHPEELERTGRWLVSAS